jgi:phenylalanyl-tRNA synthetase alpha chain
MSLSSDQLARALELRDLSDPAAGPHAMQEIVAAIAAALSAAWSVPVRVPRCERVVTVHDNYDALRYSPDAAARDRRYTRYLGDGRMLRAHTTAHVPGLLREISAETVLCVPGVCYRRDVIDRHHVGEPHQLDLWRVRPDGPPLGEADLAEMIGDCGRVVLPGRAIDTPASPHPYTVDGREIYVDGVEVGECGLAHPEVLAPPACRAPPAAWRWGSGSTGSPCSPREWTTSGCCARRTRGWRPR